VRLPRAILALTLSIAVGALVALGLGASGQSGGGGYLVRAIFDNSSFVIPGEEVKVAGVTVGTIQAIDLTSQNKAAVVLQINDSQFRPFRADAHCEIGLESLLGEQFVQCTPTQPRAAGVPAPPPLPAITSGPNQGQHVLPVQNTTTPVGVDLIQDITRLPLQQRLQLIIAGLGAGLAGNGQELNAALLRADPALQQTDEVIAVLASQDRVLAQLTDESAQELAQLNAQRSHLGGFIQHAGRVAVASAQEGQAIQQNLEDLPAFLRQLGPAATRLRNLAEEITPDLQELEAQAPAINSSVAGLGPLAKTSIPAFQTLGNLAQRGEKVFPQAHQVTAQLLSLGRPLQPLSTDLASTAQSFDNAGGIEDVMRFIYYYTGSVNGEDALGHYIRSHIVITNLSRTSTLQPSSSATFACTTGTAACGSAIRAAADKAAADPPAMSSATALLHYLMAP
jgi:phospholipid/cholesterol/gamma-HCH transport system substrate-binding protein